MLTSHSHLNFLDQSLLFLLLLLLLLLLWLAIFLPLNKGMGYITF